MKINPRFMAKLDEFCSDDYKKSKGIHFGFLYTHKDSHPCLESYFLDGENSVFPYEDFTIYGINLLTTNTDTGVSELKIPFYTFEDKGEFEEFMILLGRLHISSTGHFNKKLDYSIFKDTDKDAFFQLKSQLGKDFDLQKLAKVVAKYYETTGYAQGLTNYFKASCLQDYTTYG